MKKLFAVLLAVLLPALAQAAPAAYSATGNGVAGVCASGTCDAPVEAAGTTDGLPLTSSFFAVAKGLSVTVCADSGQTLSGAGTLTGLATEMADAI